MNVMKEAWRIAREAVVKFGGKVREYFAEALKEAWKLAKCAKRTVSATFKNGNREITVTVTGQQEWGSGSIKRVYFDLNSNDKRTPIRKLYEIIAGNTRDEVVVVKGRKFGFEYGIECDSKTKRKAAKEAVEQIAAQLQ